jgi:murein DD-endopeptidase MepM/ murein hydrolase activator NlpD
MRRMSEAAARRRAVVRLGVALAAAALAAVPAAAQAPKPFGLPFADPPGPATWYVSQSYGNTVYAYYERRSIYGSGQGLHSGIDLAAPCGTPVVAVGDGVVLSVDGRGGALPHNLMIDHGNGFVSFYGHLLERPSLSEGQPVRRGEVVALSGDMYSTCHSSPHLHLEIRDSSLNRLFNPVTLVDADWHGILLLGTGGLPFERDLDAPRRWQALDEQPDIQIGGPLLNEFARPWPADGGAP